MEFRILGPLEVVEQGRALPLGGARQRTLLALLLTRANEVVSADRLIDELWGAQPPRTAANALQYHVSQLRKALAPHEAIVTQEPGYVIRVGPDELDLLRFETLVEEARQAAPELAAQRLREALDLWRGPPLADLAHESFAQTEILRLEELRLEALERRIEADLALGRYAELVGEVQVLVREHPLRERLRAALMQALYGSGRQAEALEVYRETRRLLVDELGIEPSPALQELEQAILRHDPALTSQEAPAAPRQRAIMVVATDPERLDDLLAIAEPLARRPARELILARLLRDDGRARGRERRALRAPRRARAARHRRPASPPTPRASQERTPCDSPPSTTSTSSFSTQHRSSSRAATPTRISRAVLERAPCDVGVLSGAERWPPGRS